MKKLFLLKTRKKTPCFSWEMNFSNLVHENKLLNFSIINNQLTKVTVNCDGGNSTLTIGRTITYDLNRNKLAEYTGQDTYTVYPDSVAQAYFVDVFCPLAYNLRRQNGTENNY